MSFLSSMLSNAIFLSTPSARRATCCLCTCVGSRFNFYPRPPRGGRPDRSRSTGCLIIDFYPRPPRGGRPVLWFCCCSSSVISIHALREEGDENAFVRLPLNLREFLSTPSARRATVFGRLSLSRHLHFYPRPPRGGRPSPSLRSGKTR